jgi:hypothetical protein
MYQSSAHPYPYRPQYDHTQPPTQQQQQQQQQQQAYQQYQLYAQLYAHRNNCKAASTGFMSPYSSVPPPPTYPRTPETTPRKRDASVLSRPKNTAVGRATLTNMTDYRQSGPQGSGLTHQNAVQSLVVVLPKSSMNSVQPAALVCHRECCKFIQVVLYRQLTVSTYDLEEIL